MKPTPPPSLFEQIHSALPQTQCTRCGFPDCAAYAHAIISGAAAINQCPPGGAEGIRRLSEITGSPVQALNPRHGLEGPRAVAVIDEVWCIGCTLCLKACPVDAIMGSNKLMHTVIESDCTGCELCVPACPVDCIGLENVTGTHTGWNAWSQSEADKALLRYELNSYRRNHSMGKAAKTPENTEQGEVTGPSAQALETPQAACPAPQVSAAQAEPPTDTAQRKRAVIEAALAKARAQRAPQP